MGVQPEKKLVLLLSILFFLFTKGRWFSWESSSPMSRAAAVLGFFMKMSWSVMSFRTYWESKTTTLELVMALWSNACRSHQNSIKSCLVEIRIVQSNAWAEQEGTAWGGPGQGHPCRAHTELRLALTLQAVPL